MNPDGENLCLYPLLLFHSSPSGSDSGVRLCFLLALWFMVVMIYCGLAARRQLGFLSSVSLLLSLSFCVSIAMHLIKTDTAYQARNGIKNCPSLTCDLRGIMQLLEHIYLFSYVHVHLEMIVED